MVLPYLEAAAENILGDISCIAKIIFLKVSENLLQSNFGRVCVCFTAARVTYGQNPVFFENIVAEAYKNLIRKSPECQRTGPLLLGNCNIM